MTDLQAKRAFLAALGLGLAVRLAIFSQTAGLDTRIVDEQQYRQIALNILSGNGFGWAPGQLTSIRPPLFPAFLAAVWALFGAQNLQVVRLLQILMAAATTGCVYQIGLRSFNRTTARLAASIVWLYPSFVFFNFLLLTETLFTCLFAAFVLLTVMLVQQPKAWIAVACGLTLGLATLTRSLLWPLPLVLCPLFARLCPGTLKRRVALSAVAFLSYGLIVTPWAVRNTRLQQVVTIVDTMGGINLRMGNYEYTPEDRMWDAVSQTGEKSWVTGFSTPPGVSATEGRKDKWAQRKAIEYIVANPGTTFRRSLIKFSDFWGLEREFIAGVQSGLFAPPKWFQIAASLIIVISYVAIVLLGASGVWLTPPRDWRVHVMLLLPFALFIAAHSIIFGHSRYHLPLMPLLAVYAAQLITEVPAWQFTRRPLLVGASCTVAVFALIWIRQIVLVDLARLTALVHQIG